ncbi:unnamed protein product [Arabidopsis lyrata]|nr:unnamed protein product [Arabidopsis lyrata]
MEDPRISLFPSIYYRPIKPNDLDRLEQIHRDIFPIKYESEFFQCVVNGVDIISWAAVDRSRPDHHCDELIGFVTARGVYLHVIAHNNAAICLYKRLMFRCVRRLHGFYLIKRQHFDAFLFVYFINGSRTPCSPLEVAMFVVNYMKSGIKLVASKLVNREEKGLKWLICKDTDCVLPSQTKPNLGSSSVYEFI